MKRITLLFGILFVFCHLQAQEATRGQMMDLFFKAQKAEKAGNMQEALEIYKTILSVDANLPIPYLKMANIYAANEGDQQSIAAAAALYRKYLALQPDDENAAAIAKKASELEQRTSYGDVDLNKLLYIEKEDVKQVFATKARPGLKANSKEELVQQVNQAGILYDQAQANLNAGNTQAGIQNLEQLTEQVDPSSPLYTQATMQLANTYGKQGDMQKMKEKLASGEENMEINKNLSQSLNAKINDATPFEDDICGVWVSDLSYNKDSFPFIVLTISKDATGNYNAQIADFCGLRNINKTYNKAEINNKTSDLSSSNKAVLSDNSIILTYGDEKLPEKMSDFGRTMVDAGIDVIGNVGKSVANNIIQQSGNSFGGQMGALGVGVVAGLFQGLFAQSTMPVRISKFMGMKINRLYPGYADLVLTQIYVQEKGDNRDKMDRTSTMRLVKLDSNGDTPFAIYSNFEQDGYPFKHKKSLDISANINKQSYEKLATKISDYCWAKSADDPNMKVAAQQCIVNFKYATQGLSYTNFYNSSGKFEGWVDYKNKLNGFSKCALNSGYEYIGEWKNNKYSGNGTLSYKKDRNITVIAENVFNSPVDGDLSYKKGENLAVKYTGSFVNNKFNGKGLYEDNFLSYEGEFKDGKFDGNGKLTWNTGQWLNGTWKDGIFIEGSGIYNGNTYTGKWKYIESNNLPAPVMRFPENTGKLKKVSAKIPVPHDL